MPHPKSRKAKTSKARELVLLDTGPLVGLYNEKDEWHDRCEEFFGEVARYDYLLTHAVIGEVIFHVQQDKHAKAASKATISFLSYIENGIFQVHELSGDYVSRMKIHRAKYLDKKLDFADLSLVLAAEDRQLDKIVTIDQRDFGYLKYGRKTKQKTVQAGFTVILPEL